MLDKKTKKPVAPALLDRVLSAGCQRIGVLGLHPRAGTRTVLASLLRDLHRRAWPFALTAAPRLPIEHEESPSRAATRVAVQEGAFVATAEQSVERSGAGLQLVSRTDRVTPLGSVGIYRVIRGGEVELYGPSEAEGMAEILDRLGETSGGVVFADGSWERRFFAAPGVTDGVILSMGASCSATLARSAAAARYVVETLSVPPCEEPARVAWEETASQGAAALLDSRGRAVGVLPPGLDDPVRALQAPGGSPVATIVLPHGLGDEFMIPLVRTPFRCSLVVRDATRISVAPIYFKAWLKGKGRIESVRPIRLVAMTTNPLNDAGPDADPVEFRRLVATTLPELPVHDVVLESGEESSKPLWRFWETDAGKE